VAGGGGLVDHSGEEQALVEAVQALGRTGVKIGLVMAPRHLERLGEVETQIRAEGVGVRRWSMLPQPLEAGILEAFRAGEVVLVDRYGLLGRLYGGGECSFVGGTLVPVGGHNLLEPLNWGVPVVFGPHTENAREVRDEVVRRGLGTEAAGTEELAAAMRNYLDDASLAETVRTGARALFDANRGAVQRAMAALEALGAFRGSG
jgi:3-deoxy-D-manno-octulosonic-acid transferase